MRAEPDSPIEAVVTVLSRRRCGDGSEAGRSRRCPDSNLITPPDSCGSRFVSNCTRGISRTSVSAFAADDPRFNALAEGLMSTAHRMHHCDRPAGRALKLRPPAYPTNRRSRWKALSGNPFRADVQHTCFERPRPLQGAGGARITADRPHIDVERRRLCASRCIQMPRPRAKSANLHGNRMPVVLVTRRR
jgi:hypothetical protein